MAKTFKIPFAFDENNNVVDIESAEKGIIYTCNCGSDVLIFNEIKEDCTLFYKIDCRNAAKMYKRKLECFNQEIVAFQKNRVINVKFNI